MKKCKLPSSLRWVEKIKSWSLYGAGEHVYARCENYDDAKNILHACNSQKAIVSALNDCRIRFANNDIPEPESLESALDMAGA